MGIESEFIEIELPKDLELLLEKVIVVGSHKLYTVEFHQPIEKYTMVLVWHPKKSEVKSWNEYFMLTDFTTLKNVNETNSRTLTFKQFELLKKLAKDLTYK